MKLEIEKGIFYIYKETGILFWKKWELLDITNDEKTAYILFYDYYKLLNY